jgi:quercetin dioxygenase-like cupin family protein
MPLSPNIDPKVSALILPIGVGRVAGPHTHQGEVFAYILEGDIENQVDPDPPLPYHPGDFFIEPAMHVHRMLRNLSPTEPAKVLVFQAGNTGNPNPAIKFLLQQSAEVANREGRLIKVSMPPGAALSGVHQQPGPVFAYIAKGEVENQVDPDPAKIYRAGDIFFEPPLQTHRMLRNTSQTDPAEVILFQVGDKGAPTAIGVTQ